MKSRKTWFALLFIAVCGLVCISVALALHRGQRRLTATLQRTLESMIGIEFPPSVKELRVRYEPFEVGSYVHIMATVPEEDVPDLVASWRWPVIDIGIEHHELMRRFAIEERFNGWFKATYPTDIACVSSVANFDRGYLLRKTKDGSFDVFIVFTGATGTMNPDFLEVLKQGIVRHRGYESRLLLGG